jgi:hypothetical protein
MHRENKLAEASMEAGLGSAAVSRFPNAPPAIRALPVDPRGYPIPWFVGELNGVRDFRVLHPSAIVKAARHNTCWICGRPLGRIKTFVIGPMCAVNRVSSEPPSHRICATFAAEACPFLTRPLARRRTAGLEDLEDCTAGIAIDRNPGVTLLWGCLRYTTFPSNGGILFDIGAPEDLRWYAHGRAATREEVMASITSGVPILREVAEQDGPLAIADLDKALERALRLLPKAA